MSSYLKMSFALDGFEAFNNAINNVTGRRLDQIVRTSMSYAITPMVQAARRNAPVDTGALKSSLTRIIKQYRKSVVAVVGPDRNVVGKFPSRKTGKLVKRWPAKTAHLVEQGHRIALGGKLGRLINVNGRKVSLPNAPGAVHAGNVAPNPFLQRAFDETINTVEDRLESKITELILKELSK